MRNIVIATILFASTISLASCGASARVTWPDSCAPSLKTGKIACKCTKTTFEKQDHPTLKKPAYKLVEKCDEAVMPIERFVTEE